MANKSIIKCVHCSWSRIVTESPDDVKDLFEYKSCVKCKKFRRFRCLQCGHIAKKLPLKG